VSLPVLGPPAGITFSMKLPSDLLCQVIVTEYDVVAFRVSCCNEQRTDLVGITFLEQTAL
jgi:hypothetical protein